MEETQYFTNGDIIYFWDMTAVFIRQDGLRLEQIAKYICLNGQYAYCTASPLNMLLSTQ